MKTRVYLFGKGLTLYCINTFYCIYTHFDASTTEVSEDIAGKGEIARNKHFLLIPQCFLLKQIIVSPFVNIFDIISLFAAELLEPKIGISAKVLTLYHTVPTYIDHVEEVFWKHCWKRRTCWYQHFLFFPQCFLPLHRRISILESHLFCHLQMLSIWTCIKLCRLIGQEVTL